jgi:hypothetical protein
MASAFEIAACALAPEGQVGHAVLLEGVGEDLEKAEQNLEVLGVALERFSDVRRDRQPTARYRLDLARPDGRHISFP